MFAPGIQYVDATFHQPNIVLSSFVVSVYLVGYAFGPLLAAPLCEIYGRAIVYQTTNILFVIFNIACAVAPSFNSLIGFRFLAGSAGSAPLVMGGGTIADMYPRERRGAKMALFSMGPLIGPVAGPIAGAFLAESVSWRWIFWVIAIAVSSTCTMISPASDPPFQSGVVCTAALIFLRETYAPVLLERKAAKLRKETGNNAYRVKLSNGDSPRTIIFKAFSRPAKMFTRSPLVFMFTVGLEWYPRQGACR